MLLFCCADDQLRHVNYVTVYKMITRYDYPESTLDARNITHHPLVKGLERCNICQLQP